MKTLLVDDRRTMEVDVTARTYKEAQRVLRTQEFDRLYLDHDLGGRKTGYDLVKWMTLVHIQPREILLISANPDGKRDMAEWLLIHGYQRMWGTDGYGFTTIY